MIGHIGIGIQSSKWQKVAIETGQAEIVLTPGDYTLLSQSLVKTSWPLAKAKGVGVIIGSVFFVDVSDSGCGMRGWMLLRSANVARLLWMLARRMRVIALPTMLKSRVRN